MVIVLDKTVQSVQINEVEVENDKPKNARKSKAI